MKAQVTYLKLPSHGKNNATRIYQWELATHHKFYNMKMNIFLQGFEFIRDYIDKFLIPTKYDQKYHVKKLEPTLNKLKERGLKCNIKKYLFGKKNGIFRFMVNT